MTVGVAVRQARTVLVARAAAIGRVGAGSATGPRPGLAAPRVRLALGRCVPGAAVRLAPAVLVAAVGGLTGAAPGAWAVLGVLAVALVARPALPAVAGVVLAGGLVVVTGPALLTPAPASDGGPVAMTGTLTLAGLVLALDGLLRVGALTPHVAWTARVEVAVLAGLARSLARTQAVGQGLLGLAVVLTPADVGAVDWTPARVMALLAAGTLLALLVPRRGRRPGGGSW